MADAERTGPSSDLFGIGAAENGPPLTAAFLQKVLDAIPEPTVVVRPDYQIVYANRAALEMAGVSEPNSACLKCHRVNHHREFPCGEVEQVCPLRAVIDTGAAVTAVHQHRNADGTESIVEITAAPIFDRGGNVVQIVETCRDITERRHTRRLLEIANGCTRMPVLLSEFVAELKRFTGCKAVGIRILGEDGTIPYAESDGFSPEFRQTESPLSIEKDACLCTRVVLGQMKVRQSYCTEGGSFLTGNMTRLMETVPPKVLGPTRGVCHAFEYESIALIPIRLGDEVLGLLHLADPRENGISPAKVESIERAALQLGAAIYRLRAEEELQRAQEELEKKVIARTAALAEANRLLEEEVRERNRLEREILLAAAEEQQRIGQELHDGLGQELTGLGYVARSVYECLSDQGLAEADMVAELDRGIPRALGQIRAIVKGLLPLGIGAGSLVPALTNLVANVEERSCVSCHIECDCHEPNVDDYVAVQLYRIGQEALTNAVKHGKPGQIVVTLGETANGICLAIRDNGVGIPKHAERPGGAGLRIMRYRARAIGAALEIQRPQGGGTLVRCTLPRQ